jgi:plastocyanin
MKAMISRRLLAPASAAALAAALLVPSGVAQARAGASVSVADMAFTPASVTVGLGETVTWRFPDSMGHTTTSDAGFWDSGTKLNGATYSRAFTSAGTFAYHCSIHPTMRGKVRVPVKTKGSPSAGWTLTWSTKPGGGKLFFDVQTRLGSGAWRVFMGGAGGTHRRFDPAQAGTYSVRARTVTGANRSGWSPAVTVTVS